MKKQILFNPDNSADGICRTIKTSYHKISTANLIRGGCYGASGVLEIETMQKLINPESNENARRITGVMEEVEPKIVGYTRDSKGKVVKRSLRDTSNTVTTFTGSGHNTDMYMAEPMINVIGKYDSSQNSRVIGTDGVSYCMTNGHKDGMPKIIEPNVLHAERTEQCKQLRKQNGDKGMKFNQGNKEYNPRTDGVSNTLTTSTKDNMLAVPELRMEEGCLVDKDGRRYRIRKLTPTECFRLQDVSDEDIEKIKSYRDDKNEIIRDVTGEPIMNMDFVKPRRNEPKITVVVNGEQREYYGSQLIWRKKGKEISKTAQYKLAGNSICVAPMYHIFRKLFIEKECENQQLELF